MSISWKPHLTYAAAADDVGALDLPGQEEARGRIQPGARDPGQSIRAAGPGRDQGHTEVVGVLAICLACDGGCLLVQVADVLEARAPAH